MDCLSERGGLTRVHLFDLQDDPYRALVLSHEAETPVAGAPSFLSIDVDGRVLDISSFSKVRSRYRLNSSARMLRTDALGITGRRSWMPNRMGDRSQTLDREDPPKE